MLDRMLAEESPDRVIDAPERITGMYPVLAREYPAAKETGSFSKMENELYKQFYADIIRDAGAVESPAGTSSSPISGSRSISRMSRPSSGCGLISSRKMPRTCLSPAARCRRRTLPA